MQLKKGNPTNHKWFDEPVKVINKLCPINKINATQLTHQRNNPKHSNHCKETGRGGKSLVSLQEKFLGSRCSYAKKNTDAVPFTSTCLVPHCKTEKLP